MNNQGKNQQNQNNTQNQGGKNKQNSIQNNQR